MAAVSFENFAESYNKEEFGKYLRANGVSARIDNNVDGRTFLMLNDDDLKELITLIGEKALIRRLLNACKMASGVSVYADRL